MPERAPASIDMLQTVMRWSIDMARIVLRHGKDERIRRLAADVVREQEREIAQMQAWLAKRGSREPPGVDGSSKPAAPR